MHDIKKKRNGGFFCSRCGDQFGSQDESDSVPCTPCANEEGTNVGESAQSSPATAPISLDDIMQVLLEFRAQVRLQVSDHATKREITEIQARLSEIRSYYDNSSIPMTPSHYGYNLLEDAARTPAIISSFVPSEGEAIFDTLFSFTGASGEKDLVVKVYTRIQELLGDRRLISSENTVWLETSRGKPCIDQNPDLICLHKAYVHFKKIREDGVVFGVPENMCFCSDLFIFDVKTSPGNDSFGELAIHIRYLRLVILDKCKRKEPIEIRGALVHNQGIWLVRFQGTEPREIIKMLWTDKGSVRKFQEFFCAKDEMSLVLDEVCKVLEHDVAEHTNESSPPCFLGAGGSGKVFRVFPKGSTRAVKIVLGHKNIHSLLHESEMMRVLNGKGLSVEFVDMHVVKRNGVGVGAGLIMEPVGIPISNLESTSQYLSEALRVLSNIHRHDAYHGDPRVQNILLSGSNLLFCDFRHYTGFAGIENRAKVALDIEILLSSFEVKITDEVRGKIDQYAADKTVQKIEELITAITDKFK